MPKNDRCCKLAIKKDKEHSLIRVEGATTVPVDFWQAKELMQVYYQGLDNRVMRSTDVNETSIIPLIFSIYIERTDKTGLCEIGKIIFIIL